MALFKVDFDDRAFQKALKDYLKWNKRDMGMLVEQQARKVVLGVGRGGGNVKGLKQLAHKYRATRPQIRAEMKPLWGGWVHDGGRGKKRFVSFSRRGKKRGNTNKFVGIKKKELQRRQKFSGFTAKGLTMAWPYPKKGRNVKIKPKMKTYHRVQVSTAGPNPSVTFTSSSIALVQMDKDHNIARKALQNGTKDMAEYVARKVAEQFGKAA